MTKSGTDKNILNYISRESPRPISTRELSEHLKIAWHTADRYCLKLQVQGKVSNFTVGKSTAWYIKK